MNAPSASSKLFSYFPFDFQLAAPDGSPTLYINDNPAAQDQLVLTISNRSGQTIRFGGAAPDPGYFTLHFRKGILSAKTLALLHPGGTWQPLTPDGSWQTRLVEEPEGYALGFNCLKPEQYFELYGGIAWFRTERPVKLTLPNMSAASAGGERATSVLFLASAIMPGPVKGRSSGNRRQPLAVQTPGAADPNLLSASLAGAQKIVNDGVTPNRLILQIINTHYPPEPLYISPGGSATPTTLTLSFVIGDVYALYALTDGVNAGKIVCTVEPATLWHALDVNYRQGQTPEFSFTTDTVMMVTGETVYIMLDQVFTKNAAGQANLLVRCKNLPNYGDWQTIVTVQKGQ